MDLSRRGLLAGILGVPFARAFKAADIQPPKPIPGERGISLPIVPSAPHVITISDGKRKARVSVTQFQVDSWAESIEVNSVEDHAPRLMAGLQQCTVTMTAFYDETQWNTVTGFLIDYSRVTVSRAEGHYHLGSIAYLNTASEALMVELMLRRVG